MTGIGLVMSSSYYVGLFAFFLYLHNIARKHVKAGIIWGIVSLLFIAAGLEILSLSLTGVHLSPVTAWTIWLDYGGPSISVIALAGAAAVIAITWLFQYLPIPWPTLPNYVYLYIVVISLLISQLIYGSAYLAGSPEILQAKRRLPLFEAFHPWYYKRAAQVLGLPDLGNQFALKKGGARPIAVNTEDQDFSTITNRDPSTNLPDILFIVVDSLRAYDIKLNPEYAPFLNSLQNHGHLSLDHKATANCTHFSMFSLLTGRLPSAFSDARRQPKLATALKILKQQGYMFSSAEAENLDWYETADSIFNGQIERHIAESTSQSDRDQEVTDFTLQSLRLESEQSLPRLHLAYYAGTHYPYGLNDTDFLDQGNLKDAYIKSVQYLDQELSRLWSELDRLGLTDDLIIILTSDHGEEFGEEGQFGHSGTMNHYQMQVPFFVNDKTENWMNVQSHMDIVPTLLKQLGFQKPSRDDKAQPVILADCDYDFPKSFTVIDGDEKLIFDFDSGYLTPQKNPDNGDRTNWSKAAQALLKEIRKGRREYP